MNPWELENPYWNFETRNHETVMIFSLRKQYTKFGIKKIFYGLFPLNWYAFR